MSSKRPSRQAGLRPVRGVSKSRRRYLPFLEPVEPRLLLTAFNYTVDALTDTGAGTGFSGDLRYAITQANLNPGSTINITASGTDTLGSSLPALAADVTINDSTPGTFSVVGGGPISNYNALTINSGVTASIIGVDFNDFNSDSNGAILDVEGTLALVNSTLFSSTTTGNGGGILVNGTLTAEGCLFEFLSAGSAGLGGAICNNGTLIVIGGGFGNCSGEDGGAIGSTGSLDVNGVVFIDNTASFVGGAIYCNGATITNSTVTGNSASNDGGGINFNAGASTLTNDTIANNVAPSGATGAGVNVGLASLLMNNTIVAQNMAGSIEADLGSIGGPLGGSVSSSSSHNIIGDTTFSSISDGLNGNLIGTSGAPIDAMLAPPGINGGPVVSQALLTGSPAIGAGLVADAVDPTTGDPLQFDQRGMGFPRVVNNLVDIGSFQTQSTAVATDLSVQAESGIYGGTVTLSATLTSGGGIVGDEQVDFHLGSMDLGLGTTDNVTGIATLSNVPLGFLNAGNYTGYVTATFDGDSNFAASSGSADLTVTPAPLTITANNKNKAYGAALPTLDASYTGFVNGDTAASLTTAPTITTTATAASHVSGNPYSITASGAVDSDYTISYVAGSLTVTAAPLTITADDETSVYGAALPTLTASYTGFVNGDTSASLTTAPTITTTATSASHVAGSPYSITASGAVDSDYTISYVDGSLTVTAAPLTISADDQTNVYGAALPTLTASYTGFVNGDTSASLTTSPTITTTATSASHVSGSPYSITASGAIDTDYTISYVDGSLTVTAAPLTITADDQTSVYGATLPTFTASYGGFVNGDTSASLDTLPTITTTATSFSDVTGSPYAITASGAVDTDYTISYVAGNLTITPAPLVITADNLTKVYGQVNPTLTGTVTGIFNNDDVTASYITPATQYSDVVNGGYSITLLSLTGTKASDYSTTVEGGSVTSGVLAITPAPLTIQVADQSKVYGQANPNPTGLSSGVLNGDDVTVQFGTSASQFSDVALGGYPILPTGLGGAKAEDYSFSVEGSSVTPGTLTITPAPLAIVVNNQTKVYGQPNPTLTGNVAGILNGDDVTGLYATTATSSSHVVNGGYAITFQGLLGAKVGDYTVNNFVNGTLAVTPAPLAISAPNVVKTYGQPVPTLTPSYSDFVNGDSPASLSLPVSLTTTAGSASHVGNYPIVASGAASLDYAITYNNGSVSVTPATLDVLPVTTISNFGRPVPTLTVNYLGFVNGDTAANLTTPVNLSTTANAISAPGVYPITASGATSSDYTIVNYPATVVVLQPNPGQIAFINSLYQTILHRAPEPAGLAGWFNALNQGVTRATVARLIYNSPEAVADRAHHIGQPITLARALHQAIEAQNSVASSPTPVTTSSVVVKAASVSRSALKVRPAQVKKA